ncbi:class I SAM-dependent methyltransferase [Bacillus sp. JJ722]|uniref:class I SAM-dependent methyltransferase n=1 Tax=Bacillus sp. JJ722 TaxID=3122973 RepID=UPI003000E6CA
MNNKVEEAYNQLANDYEENVDMSSPFNTEYERPAMMNLLPLNLDTMRILDAGCAAGWYTNQFVMRGADVIATDLSPEMVAATKRRIGDKAKVFCLNLEEELPFEDDSFDVIVSSLVLHYIKDWRQPLSEFQRILKHNGKLIFSVHHPFMDFKLSKNGDYFHTEFILDQWERKGKIIEVPFYRRSLSEIFNTTLEYFSLDRVIEPQPTDEFKKINPEKYNWLMKNPHFLIINAINDKLE